MSRLKRCIRNSRVAFSNVYNLQFLELFAQWYYSILRMTIGLMVTGETKSHNGSC